MNIKRIILSVICVFTYLSGNCQQLEPQSDSLAIKKMLYHSMICDTKCTLPDDYAIQFNGYCSNFERFTYQTSKKLYLHTKPYSPSESNLDVYSVQLYKFYTDSQEPYFVMKFDRCRSLYFELAEDVWLRLTGFFESDVKLMFDYLTKDRKLKMNDIRYMINSWRHGDDMFNEVNWDCLIDGYLKNDTNRECFLSWTKIRAEASIQSPSKNNRTQNLYASFSTNYPLCGILR